MGVWVLAGVGFREASRKRLLWMALAAGVAFLALFAAGLHFQVETLNARVRNPIVREQSLGMMLTMGLYAVDLLAVVMAVFISVDTLSGEIASGAIQAIATKPIPRWQVLVGKWMGFAWMFAVYVGALAGGVVLLGWLMADASVPHFWRALGLILLEGMLLLSVTFLCGTFLSSLTNGIFVLALHGMAFLGGWVEQIGKLTDSPKAVNAGMVASLIMPSEALWRRAAYEMQSPLVNALRVSPFATASVPSWLMVGYGATYALLALLLATYRFQKRDL